jgi:hypothetical protein
MTGCIDAGLDRLEPEARAELCAALPMMHEELRKDPSALRGDALTRAGLGGGCSTYSDVPLATIARLTELVVALLQGAWRFGPADPESLPMRWLPTP